MNYRQLLPGDQVIRQGEIGKAMFFIIRGSCVVSSKDGDSVFAELGAGSFFGEIGVLFEIPRTANVTAKTKCLVAALTRSGLDELLSSYHEMADELLLEAIRRYEQLQEKLQSSPTLSDSQLVVVAKQVGPTKHALMFRLYDFQYLPASALEKLCQKFVPIKVEGNTSILKTGIVSDKLHMVVAGSFDMHNGSGRLIGNMPSGTWFGELGIYVSKPSVFSYIANPSGKCSIISLSKDQLTNFIQSNMAKFPDLKVRIEKTCQRSKHLWETVNRAPHSELENGQSSRKRSQPSFSAMSAITDINIEKHFEADSHGNSPFTTRKSSKTNVAILEESNDFIVVQEAEDNQSSEEESDVAPAMEGRRLFPGLALETGRRRASIAVWADSKLSEFAAQQVAKSELKKEAKSRHVNIFNVEDSAEQIDIVETQKEASNIFEDFVALELIFAQLSFKALWKLRAVSKKWKRTVESSKKVAKHVDISVNHNRVDEEVVEMLTGYLKSNIEVLILKNCWKLTNKSLNAIATHCSSLIAIDLCGCWDINDDGLIALSLGCRNIKSIDLSNCRKLTDRGVASLMTNCNNLSDIYLSYCKALTDQIFVFMREYCPNIRRINIQRCIGITDNGLANFAQSKHLKLQELILSDCSFLSDNAMKSIAESCPNLVILNISFCCTLTEGGILHLIDGCRKLTTFDVSFCGNAISDDILTEMAKKWLDLKRLSIRGCIRVTDKGVQELFANCAELRKVNLSNCKGTSRAILEAVPAHIQLLDANDSVIDNHGITLTESFGSNHVRRYTAP